MSSAAYFFFLREIKADGQSRDALLVGKKARLHGISKPRAESRYVERASKSWFPSHLDLLPRRAGMESFVPEISQHPDQGRPRRPAGDTPVWGIRGCKAPEEDPVRLEIRAAEQSSLLINRSRPPAGRTAERTRSSPKQTHAENKVRQRTYDDIHFQFRGSGARVDEKVPVLQGILVQYSDF